MKTIVKMTEKATGRVTYVTARGNAKGRGRAQKFNDAAHAQYMIDTYWSANPNFTFAVETF